MTTVRTLLWPAVFGLALIGCSGETARPDAGGGGGGRDATTSTTTADAGQVEMDAGPRDTGPRDCSANPFRCAENQLMDDQCVCLEDCEGALRWNPGTGMCEEPPQGECNNDSDCNPGAVCLDTPMNGGLQPCNGQATCRCLLECDPFVTFPRSGCPPSFDFGGGSTPVACTWLGDPNLPEALCLPQGMGGEQGAACNDPMQCNRQKNFFCAGRTSNQMTGACARLCDSTLTDDVCTSEGEFRCVNFVDENLPDLGFCGDAPVTDIGATCTSSVTCQGEVCSTVLSNSCTQACGGLSLCPPEALCISFTAGAPVGEEDICMLRCSSPDATGDAECQAKNPATVCRALLTQGPALCSPPCTMGIGCQPPAMCDPGSGRCM